MEDPIIKCIITRSGQKRYYRFPRQDGKPGVDRISNEEGRRLFKGECEEAEIKDVKYDEFTKEGLQKLSLNKLKELCKQLEIQGCSKGIFKTKKNKDKLDNFEAQFFVDNCCSVTFSRKKILN